MTDFEGFGPKVHKWFKGLEADNSKEYFAANRDYFERSIRDQMEAMLTELGEQVRRRGQDVSPAPRYPLLG